MQNACICIYICITKEAQHIQDNFAKQYIQMNAQDCCVNQLHHYLQDEDKDIDLWGEMYKMLRLLITVEKHDSISEEETIYFMVAGTPT